MRERRKEEFATDITDRRYAAARMFLSIVPAEWDVAWTALRALLIRVGAQRHPCLIRGKNL